MIDVIYLAAGQGKRAGLGYPKQFARLGGKPIMIHGLEVLQKIPEVSQIIVVRPMITVESLQDWRVEEVVLEYGINKAVFVEGGRTRQESVRRGLEMVATDYVLIAEAVRPFITEDFVKRIIQLPGIASRLGCLLFPPFYLLPESLWIEKELVKCKCLRSILQIS
jgi:2-C-methyl-D-erythritol 4-phosphate cytidylyltransferase